MAESSALNIAVNVFTAPREAFAAIREKSRFWLPLLLILLGVGAVSYMYMSSVDIAWFYEQQLSNADSNLTDVQIEQVVATISQTPQVIIASLAAASSMLAIAIIMLLLALYLKIVSAVLKDGIRYGQWFGLVCWSSLPAVLSSIATGVNLLANDVSLMPQTRVNPLSFVSLFGLDTAGAGVIDQIVMNMDITSIWTIVLTVVGYKVWTNKGLALSAFIAVAPYILLVGVALAA